MLGNYVALKKFALTATAFFLCLLIPAGPCVHVRKQKLFLQKIEDLEKLLGTQRRRLRQITFAREQAVVMDRHPEGQL